MRQNLLRWLDPILLIGLFISIAIATGMILLGNDSVQSFVVGLLATIITLLIDIITRIQKTEASVLEATKIAHITGDESISPLLLQMAESYQKIKGYKFGTYTKLASDKMIELNDQLRDIASGSVTFPSRSVYDYTTEGIRHARKRIKVITDSKDLSYWNSTRGQQYLSLNLEAVSRGVQFTRIFAIEYSLVGASIDIFKKQEDAGIKVLFAKPEIVEKELIIFDDAILLIYEKDAFTQKRTETLVLEPNKVRRATDAFDHLTRLARTIRDLENT